MVDSSKKRKESTSEEDIATLLQRYETITILKLLQEMAYYAKPKMDWSELVKKTTTGITNAREYQLLWRHLAYRDSLLPVEDDARLLDDDSDLDCEMEASPAVSVEAAVEATAHVKVIAASYVPSDSEIPEDSTVEAPLTINIPYGLHNGPQEPSGSYWSSRGRNFTFPVLLQKAAEGHNGNGLASSMAPRKRRKKWSVEEDEELIAAVKRHGEGSWALIAKEEFEGERTTSQLSQRWGVLRKKCDTSNSFTQSGIQRTEAQTALAVNRALSLAVGNRLPSKKLAVGIPPILSSGSIAGGQANGANSSSSLQGQQHSQQIVQALPRAAISAQTAKSRVTGKKTTPNSTSRAELITTNSAAAAACGSGPTTAAAVPKVESGKNAVATVVPKTEPVKTASAVSLPRPSGIIKAVNTKSVETGPAASLPRPSGIQPVRNSENLKTASAASLPRPPGTLPVLNAKPVKTAMAAPLSRPSGIAASFPRPSGTISASKAEPVKTASAAFLPLKNIAAAAAAATTSQAVGPLNTRPAVNGSPKHVISSSSSNKLSPTAPPSKGPTIQNNSVPSGFASSRLAPTQRVPVATVVPRKPSVAPTVTASCKPVGEHKEQIQGTKVSPLVTTTLQANKTLTTNSAISTGKLVATKVETPPEIMPKKEPSAISTGKLVAAKVETPPNIIPKKEPSAISTGKLVAAKVETPPSLMPKKNEVPQTEVGSSTDKSSLDKPPQKESSTTVPPIVGAKAESKPKDEASEEKCLAVATTTGTVQKGL